MPFYRGRESLESRKVSRKDMYKNTYRSGKNTLVGTCAFIFNTFAWYQVVDGITTPIALFGREVGYS